VLLFGPKIDFEHGNFIVMLLMIIWGVGTVLEILVLIRGSKQKLFHQFPLFYLYLLFVAMDDVIRVISARWLPNHYFQIYWVTQFICLALGCGIIFEIYRVALRSFPGAARMARYLLLFVFGAIFVKTLANSSSDVFVWLAKTSLLLERSLRITQALAILTLVALFAWYAIPFGKNLKGVLFGYSLFIAMRIGQFVLWSYSWEQIKPYWAYAETGSYLLVLGIWTVTLWSPQAVPQTQRDAPLESDYELLLHATRAQFRRTLARLGWAARA
jgi:hypothetical protein